MKTGRRPTLEDVAAAAGVSRSTVSRVINAQAYVTEDARVAVRRAIAEIGYVPNESARALRTNRTMTVGLVVTRLRNQVFATIAQSLDESLMAAGRTLLAGSSADDLDHEAHVVSAFLRRGIDGLVLTLVDERKSLRRDLDEARIPLVLLDRESRGLSADLVLCGHREGMSAAMADLHAHGHERIGVITPPLEIRPGREVRDSFVQLGGDPDLVRSGILTEEFGRRIPEDLSLISYDDSPTSRLYDPGISSLVRDAEKMGTLAGSMIIERLNGYVGPPRKVVLPTEYVSRASVGPAPKKAKRMHPPTENTAVLAES